LASAQQQTPQKGMQRVVYSTDIQKNIFIDDVNIDRLLGNVVLNHNNIVMTCDSAYRFPNDKFEAYSNVVLINGSTTVTGDKMVYDGPNNLAQVRGHIVYLIDSATTLRTTAIDYNTRDKIGFFENEGTIKNVQSLLESKQGYYHSKTKDFTFIGNVESETENYTLKSDSMKYNTDTEIFDFYRNTHIWSKNSYLYCDNGWYDSKNEVMFFKKNSFLLSEKQEVWADSIYYESYTKQGKLYRNIQLLDTMQNSIAFGDLSDFNMETQDFEITLDPSMIFYSKDQTEDTLYLRANRLKSVLSKRPAERLKVDSITGNVDSTFHEMFGLQNVRIFRNDVQAACDSLYFGTLDSIWKMYYSPIIWNGEKMQLTGDTIKFYMLNGKMNRAEFENNSMIIMPESDTSEYYNQIKGKNMIGRFQNNELQRLDIYGNVQSIFFSSDEQVMIPHEAGTMAIIFKDRKIRRMGYYTKPTSKTIPLFMTEKEQHLLKGFIWHSDKRPKSKDDISTRIIRPSKRAEVDMVEHPVFPITMRIDILEEQKEKPETPTQ
jgi:lipopolysaccharide export system protein LptA